MNASLLILATVLGPAAADAEGDRVVAQLRDYLGRVRALRVAATARPVAAGGPFAADTGVRVEYLTANARGDEYDLLWAPPRYRQEWTEVRHDGGGRVNRVPTKSYFDGSGYHAADVARKKLMSNPDASHLHPPRESVLHAVLFRFWGTLDTRVADFLTDRGRVSVSAADPVDGRPCWRVEVRSLHPTVRTLGDSEKVAKTAVLRVWVSAAPDVRVHRWGVFVPDRGFGLPRRTIPALNADGEMLYFGAINTNFQAARDEDGGPQLYLPRRCWIGNELGMQEIAVREWQVNPRVADADFRPGAPPGYVRATVTKDNTAVGVTGGGDGVTIRTSVIAGQAGELLAAGAEARAAPTFWASWKYIVGGVMLVVVGGVVLVRARN